jgi:Flp pilus assembly protein TadB
MKFPSLFGRTPSHHRFEYKPRYYDPQKEEREERDRRIREELQGRKEEITGEEDYRSRIKGSFRQAMRRAKPASETRAALIRLVVLMFITMFLIAYLTWGYVAIYSLFLAFPVWIYFRFVRK